MSGSEAREYRSPLREERAAETRLRIVEAARQLFAGQGFAGATVAGIAERAGVSAPTVYAVFGSKGAIMTALLARLEEDADAPGWRARIDAETEPTAKLARFAQWSRQLFSTGSDVIAAALGAGSDPLVAELRAQGDRNAREWLGSVVAALASAGELRSGLSKREAVDRAWMVSGPESFFRATDGCGWSENAYEQWLTAALCDQLLVGPATSGPTSETTSGGAR